MTRQERRIATGLALRLIEGVGDGEARVEPSERVIHARRPLTSAEVELLPGGWCEIAPVDGAGEAGLLDKLARAIPGLGRPR